MKTLGVFEGPFNPDIRRALTLDAATAPFGPGQGGMRLVGGENPLQLSPQDGVRVVVLTNGGDFAFTSRVAERFLESSLGLQPEVIPGAPRGVPDDRGGEWTAFTQRVQGRYRMEDAVPPGIVDRLVGVTTRPRLVHVADNQLALEGTGLENAFLYPDGDVGRYRVAFPFANGARAVIEERPGGTDVWASILHLRRRQRSSAPN